MTTEQFFFTQNFYNFYLLWRIVQKQKGQELKDQIHKTCHLHKHHGGMWRNKLH